MANKDTPDSYIDYDRDFSYDYFGFKTLERSCSCSNLIYSSRKTSAHVDESYVGIHHENIDKALETYDLMSQGFFTHATPTLFNSEPQNLRCLLVSY